MIIFNEEEETKTDIYNSDTMRSSFYDDVKYADERSYGSSGKFDEQSERKRIREFLSGSYRDDWDD